MIDSTIGFVISTISKSVSAILHTKLRIMNNRKNEEYDDSTVFSRGTTDCFGAGCFVTGLGGRI